MPVKKNRHFCREIVCCELRATMLCAPSACIDCVPTQTATPPPTCVEWPTKFAATTATRIIPCVDLYRIIIMSFNAVFVWKTYPIFFIVIFYKHTRTDDTNRVIWTLYETRVTLQVQVQVPPALRVHTLRRI